MNKVTPCGIYRRIISLLILTFISTVGMTQFLSLGIKGGVGFSENNVYYQGKNQHRDGLFRLANFNGGLMLNLKISERWYFHSEIIFEDKGNKNIEHIDSLKVGNNSYPANQRERYHNYYIQFPQTIRFLIPLGRKEKYFIYIEAGGYFAYYIKTVGIVNYYYNGIKVTYKNNYDWADEDPGTFHRFDWGATGGVGLLVPLWKGMLDLNFKYDRMLQPFFSSNVISSKNYYDVIGITLGYTLPVLYKDYH